MVVLLQLGGWAAEVAAQETGRITGTVTNAANARPLDGAQVSIDGTTLGALANA